MPLTRKKRPSAPAKVDLTEYDGDPYTEEDDDAEEEAPRRRGLGKRIGGAPAVAFRTGADEGSGRKAKTRISREDIRDDDDDDDDDDTAGVVKRGWAAAKRAKAAAATYADEFTFTDEETLVRFLEDEPFAVFAQHWIEGGLTSTKKKSFICLGKKCPLCAIGDTNPRPMFAFNVAVIEPEEVTVKALVAGTRLLGQLENAHSSKNGPLSKGFWAVSKTGRKQTTAYVLQAVKPRDLAEDWEVDLDEVEAELTKCKPYAGDAYKPMSKAALQEIADELTEDED